MPFVAVDCFPRTAACNTVLSLTSLTGFHFAPQRSWTMGIGLRGIAVSSSNLAAPCPQSVTDLLAAGAAPRPAGQASLLHSQASTSSAAAPLLDADAVSTTLALTWLTHWRAVDEEARFRATVAEATRGRQQRRHVQLLTLLSSCNDDSAAESDILGRFSCNSEAAAALRVSDKEVTAADPARWHLAVATAAAGASQQQLVLGQTSDVDDLVWMASHPPDRLPGVAPMHEEAVGAAVGGQMRTWAAQEAVGLVQPVQLRVGWETVSVRPLWISVLQHEGSSTAK